MRKSFKRNWRRILGGFFIFLLAIIFGWSALSGENDPEFLRSACDPNPETDMAHYEVYWWQGDDTTTWSIPNMDMSPLVIPHSFTADSIVSNQYVMTYNYIKAGFIAVDLQGRRSKNMGLSGFYSYEELNAPSAPANVRIIK